MQWAGDVEYAYASNQSISVVDIVLSVVEVLLSLEIGGKIYDVGETANRVSGTELKREAASESMVRAVVLLALSLQELLLQPLQFGLLISYITLVFTPCWIMAGVGQQSSKYTRRSLVTFLGRIARNSYTLTSG